MKSTLAALLLAFFVIQDVLAVAVPGTDEGLMVSKTSRPVLTSSGVFGEPHGYAFDDRGWVDYQNGRMKSITLAGCNPHEHFSFMQVTFKHMATEGPNKGAIVFNDLPPRGAGTGLTNELILSRGEYITQVDLTTFRAKTGGFHKSRRTRIGSIRLHTNKSQVVFCGAYSIDDPSKTFMFKDQAVLHFKGSAGDAIDALEAIFIPIADYEKEL